MTVTGLLDWSVVEQGLTRRIYGAADAGLSISNATYPFACPPKKRWWFHATTVVSYSVNERSGGCVCHPSELSGKSQRTDV